jgi:hypothetical protein
MDRMPIRPEHRSLAVESCAITVAGTFLAGISPVPPAGPLIIISAAAGAVLTVVTAVVTQSRTFTAPVAAWTVAMTAWLGWVRAHGNHPWTVPALLWLIVPSLALTGWTLLAHAHWQYTNGADAVDLDEKRRREQLAAWERALAGCGFDVRCVALRSSRQGWEVGIRLPASGHPTMRTLIVSADTIATALRVPSGSVTFTEGRHAGEVTMHLDTADVMQGDVPFPAVSGLLTVTRPIQLGITPAGRPASHLFRLPVLVTGVTGAGKSNLMNVIIAQLTRCTDVVVFGVDLKGGRLFAPWIRPWVEGRCERPAVDWVATTRAEVEIMLQAVDRVITERGGSLSGGSKIRVSPAEPQLVIIADEIADVFAEMPKSEQGDGRPNSWFASLGARITRKGRSEAVQPIWGTQRGTVDFTGSTAIKSQCPDRFSLGTSSEADARAVVEETQAARLLANARHAGTVLITTQAGGKHGTVMKAYRLDADDDADRLDDLAETAGHTRPAPDDAARRVMGEAYDKRWHRSDLYNLLLARHEGIPESQLAQIEAGGVQPEPEPARSPVAVSDLAGEFRAIVSEQLGDVDSEPPSPRNRMYALLAERPVFGLSVVEIVATLTKEGIGVTRQTVHRWLAEDIDQGRVARYGSAQTPGSRYKLRRDGGQDG